LSSSVGSTGDDLDYNVENPTCDLALVNLLSNSSSVGSTGDDSDYNVEDPTCDLALVNLLSNSSCYPYMILMSYVHYMTKIMKNNNKCNSRLSFLIFHQ